MGPLLINFAPTGVVPTKSANHAVPLTPEEIIAEVRDAVTVGITMVHLHARDEAGEATSSPEIFGRIIGGVRAFAPDLVICVSLSGRREPEPAIRAAPLELDGPFKPDMASLTLSSLNFSREASVNAPATVQQLARRMLERGIVPELEIFDLGMANVAHYLAGKGLLRAPHYANIILGNVAGAQADLLSAGLLLQSLPPSCLWAFGGIGQAQLPANALAIATGGGVRIGLEDNLFLDPARRQPATNHELLRRVHDLAALHGRGVMTSVELRERLGLQPGHGAYGREPATSKPHAA